MVVSNTFCRLGWAVYISHADAVNTQHLILVLAAVELFRRAQWALLRVEWEQISHIWRAAEAEYRESTAEHEEREERRIMSRTASLNNLESLGASQQSNPKPLSDRRCLSTAAAWPLPAAPHRSQQLRVTASALGLTLRPSSRPSVRPSVRPSLQAYHSSRPTAWTRPCPRRRCRRRRRPLPTA